MPDLVAQMIDVVGDALSASMFVPTRPTGSRERYSPSEFRQLHANAFAGRIHYPTLYLYTMDVRTETSKRAALVDVLRKQLSPVVDKTGEVGVIEKKLTLDEFAVATLRAAAILSPREAATVIHHWIAGGPWIETLTFTLTGISVSEPLNVRPGMSFKRLPEQAHQIFGHVPNTVAIALQRGQALQHGGLLGSTVLCFEQHVWPVLRNADQKPELGGKSAVPGGFRMYGHFLKALSLVCNTPVVDQYYWSISTPVQQAFYVRGAESWRMPASVRWPQGSVVQLTGPLVEQALCLSAKLQSAADPQLVERVFGRWMNSFRGHGAGDQLIEIRIALETLYATGGTHEASLRVAYHGARHLGRNLEERKALYRDLKRIYGTASTVIHGRIPRKPEKARDLVKRAKGIIRDALLKILEDGEIPDWTNLMLEDV